MLGFRLQGLGFKDVKGLPYEAPKTTWGFLVEALGVGV